MTKKRKKYQNSCTSSSSEESGPKVAPVKSTPEESSDSESSDSESSDSESSDSAKETHSGKKGLTCKEEKAGTKPPSVGEKLPQVSTLLNFSPSLEHLFSDEWCIYAFDLTVRFCVAFLHAD